MWKRFSRGLILAGIAVAVLGGLALLPGVRDAVSELRYVTFHAIGLHDAGLYLLSSRSRVPCEESVRGRALVALIAGQSNAANSGDSRHVSRQNVYNFYHGRCYRARDPLVGAQGTGGSIWSRLGDRLVEGRRYERVLVVPVAVSGTQIERWAPSGDLHARILDAITRTRAAGIQITHVLWQQGESDASAGTSKEQYMAAFEEMVKSMRDAGVGAPVYVALTTRCGRPKPAAAAIRSAQAAVVDPSHNVFAGPDIDALGEEYRQADECHLNEAGLERSAALWLERLR